MEDFVFHEGEVPSGYKLEFEESIFNQSAHRALQSAGGWLSFHALNKKKKKVSASVHFHISDSAAVSPLRNPFGGIEFSDSLRPIVLFLFIEFVDAQLTLRKLSRCVVKLPPAAHQPTHAALLQTFLLNNNYRVINAEASGVIQVTKNKFETQLHRSERRKLLKCRSAKLTFKRIDIRHFADVYEFIENCRHQKEYELSMSLTDLEKTVSVHKGKYLLFGVYDKKKLVAASIAIRVRSNMLYDFYHDHTEEYDHLSPIVLLVEGMYKYCSKNKIGAMDLGTSSIEDVPNFGLLNFKMKLGAVPSPKLTLEKVL